MKPDILSPIWLADTNFWFSVLIKVQSFRASKCRQKITKYHSETLWLGHFLPEFSSKLFTGLSSRLGLCSFSCTELHLGNRKTTVVKYCFLPNRKFWKLMETRVSVDFFIKFSGRKLYQDACKLYSVIPVSYFFRFMEAEKFDIDHRQVGFHNGFWLAQSWPQDETPSKLGPASTRALAIALTVNTRTSFI